MEGAAIQQLEKTAELPGMRLAVGLPDLHPGKGTPIGAAFLTENWIYPALVGNDIGCGIGLWRSGLDPKRLKRDVWAERLHDLEDKIGGGNHFAEVQVVQSGEHAGVYLCVHSGSRGLGEAILREHVGAHGSGGLEAASADGIAYLARHDEARAWAVANRASIAARMCEQLRTEAEKVVDICHNFVEARDGLWIHRKGAAPSTEGPVVIPGSRGALTYLVRPVNPTLRSGYSLAHGAGRKWSRTESRGKLEKRFHAKDLERTELGSVVICEDRELLYEEAPQAYKNITVVIEDLVREGLAEVVAALRPVVTYKVRR
jgi:release factor H-coupled RctB family protein